MCVGPWDLATSSMGGEDIKYRDAATLMINGKVGGKCDILFFVEMCFLLSTLDFIVQKAHWTHYDVFTKCFPCYPRQLKYRELLNSQTNFIELSLHEMCENNFLRERG